MRHRNPYARHQSMSARQLRRAATPSARQKTRIVRELRADSLREIKKGLRQTLAARDEPPTDTP